GEGLAGGDDPGDPPSDRGDRRGPCSDPESVDLRVQAEAAAISMVRSEAFPRGRREGEELAGADREGAIDAVGSAVAGEGEALQVDRAPAEVAELEPLRTAPLFGIEHQLGEHQFARGRLWLEDQLAALQHAAHRRADRQLLDTSDGDL